VEVHGLVRDDADVLLLVPADPIRPRRPDEHFAAEARAARDLGVDVAVVDHDILAAGGDVAAALAAITMGGDAVYRGWMLRSDRYAAFAEGLARRGVTLRTNAEQYRRAHELPGWHSALKDVTPRSAWTIGVDRADFDKARLAIGSGPAVLRDYSKSMKHYWHEAAYIPDVQNGDAAWKVASRFLELREDEFVGGFVLREFEPFPGPEVRTWWVDGRCVLVGPHPDTPDEQPPAPANLDRVASAIRDLGLPFVTADLARRADGVWRVVEVGDGQVSDRPSTMDPATLISAILGLPD
jgi:hypothetical protein